jgi:hypothetical protein
MIETVSHRVAVDLSTARGLGINAAFLQELKDDNVHLSELLDAAAAALPRCDHRSVRPFALVNIMRNLRDQLAMHFSLEEAFGYFDGAIDVPPHLSARANTLRRQHETLYLEMCDIVEKSEQLLYHQTSCCATTMLRRIAEGYDGFYQNLQEHESRERALIMESIYDDIGVVD